MTFYFLDLLAWPHPLWCGPAPSPDDACVRPPQVPQVRSTTPGRLCMFHTELTAPDDAMGISPEIWEITHSRLFLSLPLSAHSDGRITHRYHVSGFSVSPCNLARLACSLDHTQTRSGQFEHKNAVKLTHLDNQSSSHLCSSSSSALEFWRVVVNSF